MTNKPVAWMNPTGTDFMYNDALYNTKLNWIPLYTQDQLEEARKLGMQQERALWNLSTSTQEIMDTHPAELTDAELYELLPINLRADEEDAFMFARAILLKAQEK